MAHGYRVSRRPTLPERAAALTQQEQLDDYRRRLSWARQRVTRCEDSLANALAHLAEIERSRWPW
jgi:hypothetical protein